VVGLVGLVGLAALACQRTSVARTIVVDAARLPENPEAGRRSEEQWRVHMAAEERERQLGYDKRKLSEHRALRRLLDRTRARIDQARTPAALARTRAALPALIDEAQRRLTAIDQWGNNSRLHPDYQALIATLAGPYPDAKLAALKGAPRALETLRAEVDRRRKKMAAWLADAAASEDD
jgi:hypothetical protein